MPSWTRGSAMRDHDDVIERAPSATQPLPTESISPTPPLEPSAAERVLTTRQLAWRRFKRHRLAIGSAVVLAIITLGAILAPVITPYGFGELDLKAPLE